MQFINSHEEVASIGKSVYGLPSFEQRISEIISSDKISADEILSKENLKLCAWAKLNLPSEYARLKSKLRKFRKSGQI